MASLAVKSLWARKARALGTILAVLISIPLGTLSALYKDTWIDHLVRVISIAGLAVPSFWLGMLVILGLLCLLLSVRELGAEPISTGAATSLPAVIPPP